MNCEDFLKRWQFGDTLTDDMKAHLLECKHCASKVNDYNEALGYIKEGGCPTKVDVVATVMQHICNAENIATPKPKKKTFRHIAAISTSVAAALALALMVQNKMTYAKTVELQNEDIAGMFDDVYGYYGDNQYMSYNELDVIEYFLENYEE